MKTNKLLLLLLTVMVSFASYGQNPFTEMLNDPATRAIIDADIPTRDQVILDDLIVTGSACVGQDCVNNENFGFDTVRLKENNLRIGFTDTSSSGSFPSNDWEITINDSANGGANYFGVTDVTAGRRPFTVMAGAPANSLHVDDAGRIGLGTSQPVVELHMSNGDSPTMRLEQNGTSGFTPQTWDVAGNEANFFVRDVTNSSQLPFKIVPGTSTNTLVLKGNGIGVGTQSPNANASIDLKADNKGLLLNRVNTSNRDAITTAGMVVFDLDEGKFYGRDAAAWVPLGGGGSIDQFFFSPFNNKLFISLAGDGVAPLSVDLTVLRTAIVGDIEEQQRSQVATLQDQIDALTSRLESMEACGCYNDAVVEGKAVGNDANVLTNKAYLSQNIPNPFDNTTSISYFVPFVNSKANIVISNATGQILENRSIDKFGQGSVIVSKARMSTGIYFYTLYVDGKKIDTKRMVVE